MTREEKMTPEEAIAEISYLKVAVNKVVEQALDMAIQALSQEPTFDDECQKDMDEAWEQIQKKRKRIPVTLDLTPCDDAISRILKRMWNCRGKHTTSIDKVAMEQIIRDELPPVTQKSGKWIGIDEEPHEDYECSCCGYVVSTFTANIEPHTEYKYCPSCGAKMESEDKE